MASMEFATIDPKAACLTLVNVYEVEAERQSELVKALSESSENIIRYQPGFISVCIHSSLDGKKVVNYSQWESKEQFDSFMKKPETQEQLKQFAGLAKTVSPSLYRVNSVHIKS